MRYWLILLFVLLQPLCAALAQTQNYSVANYAVEQVLIEGQKRVDKDALLLILKVKPGQVSQEQITEDIKALYNTGFFDQVTATLVKAEGKAAFSQLKFLVVEKPTVRKVYIKGNEHVDESDLAEVLKFEGRRFLDKGKLDALVRAAGTLYQGRGYYDATFETNVVPVAENQVDITFTVKEGERFRISHVEFTGLKQIDADDLRAVIQTKRYKWWSSWLLGTGRVNKEMLENDRLILRQYFLDHGYIDATVSEAQIEREEKDLFVSFNVSEGAQYRVGRVTASGDLVEGSVESTLHGIKSVPGDVFSASNLREDSFAISEKYSDKGYAFANVVPNTGVERDLAKVHIDFVVTKGNTATVGKINISGNKKTYDNVIRREMKIQEQELYSSSKVRRSQALLQRTGYFEEVNVSHVPSDQPEQIDLNVNVREASTGTFSVGAGYSTSDGPIFSTKLAEQNVFGSGRSVTAHADIGTERNNFVLSIDDRRFMDTYTQLGFDAYVTTRDYHDYWQRMTGLAWTAGYPVEEVLGETFNDVQASLKYEVLQANISHIEDDAAQLVKDSEGNTLASGITPRLVRNTIDNPINPTSGSKQSLSVELTGLGGDERFYLFDFRHQLYYPVLPRGHGDVTFAWRFDLGYGESFNGDPLPLYRRFYGGGINSVRGYKNRRLTPKDENGADYGGAKQLINNLEFILPFVRSAGVQLVAFYDVGNVYDDNQSLDLGELRQGYGFGFRWNSPMGPMRLEFGFPLDRQEGDSAMVTMFSFGAPL
jgi:outer membrane protein insertion porin family